MTDLPYDSSLDLGELPGGDIPFTEPTTSVAGEPAPTAAVPPAGGTAYRPDPPVTVQSQPQPPSAPPARPTAPITPVPPARWPRPDDPTRPRTTARPRTAPPRRQGHPRRGRAARGAWPLVALLIWVVPAGVNAIRGHSDVGSSQFSTSAAPQPSDGAPVDHAGMTILQPHSLTADSQLVTIHVDPPRTGDYTITLDGRPEATDVTTARDYGVDIPTESTEALIVSSDSTVLIRCEIRDGAGEVVAVGEAMGILDCVYDPAELLE